MATEKRWLENNPLDVSQSPWENTRKVKIVEGTDPEDPGHYN